jgi:hypothetical protein
MMEDQEDAFWADDGVYEQMGARVTEYIKANRKCRNVFQRIGRSYKTQSWPI